MTDEAEFASYETVADIIKSRDKLRDALTELVEIHKMIQHVNGGLPLLSRVEKAWQAANAALAQQAPTPAVLTEPAAWIEHHKGGDNLIWEPQKGSPRVTPLYTHPAVSEPAAPVVPTSLEDMRALLATAPAVSREAEPAAPVDARDANARRYEWLRERVEVRQMAAITGTVRPAIEVGIGCAFFDSRIPKSYPPEAGIERSAKLDAAIDAAIDAALTRQAAAPAEGKK